MIQCLSHSKLPPVPQGKKPVASSVADEAPGEIQDHCQISQVSHQPRGSAWLNSLKKTALMAGLAACLAGPLAGTASAQCHGGYYPQPRHRATTVQVDPYYGNVHIGRHQHGRGGSSSVGVTIGPGGISVQAGTYGRPWGGGCYPNSAPPVIITPPVVVTPPPVILTPPVVITPPPVVMPRPPVVYAPAPVIIQPGWGY